MACEKCAERRKNLRDAILRGKIAEAAGHVVAGARELIGTDPADAPQADTKAVKPQGKKAE